jgi:hypothetical protein
MLSLLFLSPIAQVNPPVISPIDRLPAVVQPANSGPERLLPSPLPPQERSNPSLPPLQKQEQMRRQEVRALPGQIDQVPVFNSNSPEVVLSEGILLSTFSPTGMAVPGAHLNYAFNGRFDIFSHHISRAGVGASLRTLFQGILLHNPGEAPATVEVLQASSRLTRPEALFIDLPKVVEDPFGRVFSGPGSRVVGDVLRGHRDPMISRTLTIPPKTTQLLLNMPIPAGVTTPTSNGRSTLMRLKVDQPIHVANLAMFAPREANGRERMPTLDEWQGLLVRGDLAGPRDRPPTPLDSGDPNLIYGRVAGVSTGSQWTTQLVDDKSQTLSIPAQGEAFSYGISLLHNGRFGTGQIQSAPLLARYSDTAYMGNGNYGVQYNLTLPLRNPTNQYQTISLSLDTPVKQDKVNNLLLFLSPPEPRIFFRGPVRIRYQDNNGAQQTRYFHIVQRRGEQGVSLLDLRLAPNESRSVEVNVLYPPDATPPQLLTVTTQNGSGTIAGNTP